MYIYVNVYIYIYMYTYCQLICICICNVYIYICMYLYVYIFILICFFKYLWCFQLWTHQKVIACFLVGLSVGPMSILVQGFVRVCAVFISARICEFLSDFWMMTLVELEFSTYFCIGDDPAFPPSSASNSPSFQEKKSLIKWSSGYLGDFLLIRRSWKVGPLWTQHDAQCTQHAQRTQWRGYSPGGQSSNKNSFKLFALKAGRVRIKTTKFIVDSQVVLAVLRFQHQCWFPSVKNFISAGAQWPLSVLCFYWVVLGVDWQLSHFL